MQVNITVEKDDQIATNGGELETDDYSNKEYGIQIGELSLWSLNPEQMSRLGCEIIDHLILNGHRFEFVSRPGEHDQLVEKDTH